MKSNPKPQLVSVGLFAVLGALAGCMSATQGLDRKAILAQLHQGQSRDEVRHIVGTPQHSTHGANGKTLDFYQIVAEQSDSYVAPVRRGEGPREPGPLSAEVRTLTVLYDKQDRVEEFLHHLGHMGGGSIGGGKVSAGSALTEEKVAKIQKGATTREDLERLFGHVQTETLNIDGDHVALWVFLTAGRFDAKGRMLSVVLDVKSQVKDFSLSDVNEQKTFSNALENCQEDKTRAEQGDAKAQFNLAGCYGVGGHGVKKNTAESMNWLRKSAEQGYAAAQFQLAADYNSGEGVAKDYAQAAVWYRKAAEQDHVLAQFYLAALYHAGNGVGKDLAQAAEWYRKAAARNHADAQFYLGSLYQSGAGVKKDPVEAYAWLELAAKTKENAVASRDLLAKSMSPEQVAQARTRAQDLETEIEAKLKSGATGGHAP